MNTDEESMHKKIELDESWAYYSLSACSPVNLMWQSRSRIRMLRDMTVYNQQQYKGTLNK